MNREEYAFAYNINGTGMSGIITMTNPPKLVCYCDEENSKTILKALNPSLPPAEGAEKSCLSCRFHNSPTYHDKMWCRDCQQLSHYEQQPTAEGAGKTCHAKEMEYNHNMCAMQESCEKCEAYKVPTNEGDIAKTETDTGRIVDMPDLSQPTAEGAEQRIRVRNILQDFYRRGEYELEQAEEDIMRLFQHQPTAEGAEDFLKKYTIYCKNVISIEGKTWVLSTVIPQAMREFATLHAQRIADKMVSERLRKELGLYNDWLNGAAGKYLTSPYIDEYLTSEYYLKTRESHD